MSTDYKATLRSIIRDSFTTDNPTGFMARVRREFPNLPADTDKSPLADMFRKLVAYSIWWVTGPEKFVLVVQEQAPEYEELISVTVETIPIKTDIIPNF